MRELETKKASGRLLRERRGPGGEARLCPPEGKGTKTSLSPAEGLCTTPQPCPPPYKTPGQGFPPAGC